MQAVELPSSYDIATRGTLPTSTYGGRPSFSSRTNRRYATPRTHKGNSPSRGPQSASPQKRAAIKTPSPLGPLGGEEERALGARGIGSLQQQQPTARSSTSNNSSSVTAVQSVAAGAHYQKTRHNSNSSSKHQHRQPQQG